MCKKMKWGSDRLRVWDCLVWRYALKCSLRRWHSASTNKMVRRKKSQLTWRFHTLSLYKEFHFSVLIRRNKEKVGGSAMAMAKECTARFDQVWFWNSFPITICLHFIQNRSSLLFLMETVSFARMTFIPFYRNVSSVFKSLYKCSIESPESSVARTVIYILLKKKTKTKELMKLKVKAGKEYSRNHFKGLRHLYHRQNPEKAQKVHSRCMYWQRAFKIQWNQTKMCLL